MPKEFPDRLRILIAEDDANIRKGTAALLEAEGAECLLAADGIEAWQMFRDLRPSFCTIDIMMPGMDGLGLCRAIRGIDTDVPIIMLTARDTEIDRVVGLELGADDYIAKPFGPRELIARVRAIQRRTRGGNAKPAADATKVVFHMHDLKVDPAGLRAYRNDQVIDLTAREIEILATLNRYRNQVVTRDTLFDLCWGRDFMPNSRALDQCIVGLRRKIERDPTESRIIATVHGAGYRYDE